MTTDKTFFIHDFFSESNSINEKEVFPVAVVGTLSSGKSTLINSLLDQQMLPSGCMPCTAKRCAILNDGNGEKTKIYVTYINGNTVVYEENIAEELEKANKDDSVTEILIKGHVKGGLNTDKALLLIDTPAPNISWDVSPVQIMCDTVKKIKGGIILFVLDAASYASVDNTQLLQIVMECIKNTPDVSLLFAINKVDQLYGQGDEELEHLMLSVRNCLEAAGVNHPQIIPVSSLAASLFKKVLNGEKLTESEYEDFCMFYRRYRSRDFDMQSFAITDNLPTQNQKAMVRDKEYSIRDLNRAIENTGITLLEEEIQRAKESEDTTDGKNG